MEADKIFESLKYEKLNSPLLNYFEYNQTNKNETATISFDCNSKTIMGALYMRNNFESRGLALTVPEIKAIYKKCEELGWIDE